MPAAGTGPARAARPAWPIPAAIAGGLLFGALAFAVVDRATQPIDEAILLAIRQQATPLWTALAFALAFGGAGLGLVAQWLGLALLLWRTAYRDALLLPALALGGGVVIELLKLVFQRPRPGLFEPLARELSYSFPSGHAGSSFSFYGALVLVVWLTVPGLRRRLALSALLIVLIVAVGLSRLYLGVHYPSDVLGGYAAGLVWLAACALVLFRLVPTPLGTRGGREEGPPSDGP